MKAPRVGDVVLYETSTYTDAALVVFVDPVGSGRELGMVDLVAFTRDGEQIFRRNVPFEKYIPGLSGFWRWRPDPVEESS